MGDDGSPRGASNEPTSERTNTAFHQHQVGLLVFVLPSLHHQPTEQPTNRLTDSSRLAIILFSSLPVIQFSPSLQKGHPSPCQGRHRPPLVSPLGFASALWFDFYLLPLGVITSVVVRALGHGKMDSSSECLLSAPNQTTILKR